MRFLGRSALVPLGLMAGATLLFLYATRPEDSRNRGPSAIGIHATLRALEGEELSGAADDLQVVGVRWAREEIAWSVVEPAPGDLDWSRYDPMVRETAKRRIRLIAVLNSPPEWATGDRNEPPVSGPALEQFSRFVRAAIERYGTGGRFWAENPDVPPVPVTMWNIWNEPYLSYTWGGRKPDPAAYARMFRGAVAAAHDIDPTARFMLEADTATGGFEEPYLAAMFDAVPDLARYADVVSVHPYSGPSRATTCSVDAGDADLDEAWRRTRDEFCRIRVVRRILDDRGGSEIPIWITEIGWTTAPQAERGVEEADQARNVADVFRLLREWGGVEGVVWYQHRSGEADPSDPEEWYGLLRADGTPKPAWKAFLGELSKAGGEAPNG